MAYDAAARAIRGPSARTNFPSAVEASLGRCMVGQLQGLRQSHALPRPPPPAPPRRAPRRLLPLGHLVCRRVQHCADWGGPSGCRQGSSVHEAANALWNSPLAAKGCGDPENSGDSSVVTGDTGSVERAGKKRGAPGRRPRPRVCQG